MPAAPRIFTIPASVPFLPTLIGALAEGRLIAGFTADDPLAFARATLYLPTRRACRLARDAFLDVLGRDAAILPRLTPLGDIDEDEIAFADAAAGTAPEAALTLPEALGGLERRLLLARLIEKWATSSGMRETGDTPLVAGNPAAALALADDLARLMDDMTTRRVPWKKLDGLVPENLDEYWQLTLKFLHIARGWWPAELAERGKMEPAARRDALIAAEAARLARADGPVIAAGSTGSIPATAELIAAIAKLPHGAVVLPSLDQDLDAEAWSLIGGRQSADGRDEIPPAYGHPQFAMHGLLARLGITRDAVTALRPPEAHGRELVLSEAMRPAETTQAWQARIADAAFAACADAAFAQLSYIEAANAEDEALAVAVALREALEDKRTTATLVTPDRTLARRVVAALARWNIAADDSGGDSLADTAAGIFARLAAEAALGGVAPATLLALLKHPLLRLGRPAGAYARTTATLEMAVLRGPRPRAGSTGLAHAVASVTAEIRRQRAGEESEIHWSEPRAKLGDRALAAAAALVQKLASALAPLETIGRDATPLRDIAARHLAVVEALSRTPEGGTAAFANPDGRALAAMFEDLAEENSGARDFTLTSSDYPEFFHRLIAARDVRREGRPGVRVRILGTIEARLTAADRVVLGGLNEGTWPPETQSDAWLSRPMRRALGLDLPERRIGLSAHDFAQMMGASEIVLTRAAKVAGAPTVASRFVQRLMAVAGETRWQSARERGERYLRWAQALDAPDGEPAPAERPEPKPPRAARPTRLSVTEIETLLRDPYSIYAKNVLRLVPLDPVDTPPGARDRGTVIHNAIGEFTKAYAEALPADVVAELLRIGEKHFARLDGFPEAKAFWWPRYRRIAQWLDGFERARRGRLAAVHAEVHGSLDIPLGERTFTLRARADRIERLSDGRYAVLDYKTGQPPSEKQVRTGFAPQLTLEGAILRAGKFEKVPQADSVAEIVYVTLRGTDPPGRERMIDFKTGTPDSEIDKALRKLAEVAAEFENPERGYLSRERPMFMRRGGGDYDHLARVQEWSLSGGAGDDGGDGP